MEPIHAKVRQLLAENTVSGYLGYKLVEGHPLPHLFTPAHLEEVEQALVAPPDARYPLDKVLLNLAARHPEASFAVQVRGCDERGLKELYRWGKLDPDKVVLVGVACPQEQADSCECPAPWPSVIDEGERCEPVLRSRRVSRMETAATAAAWQEWQGHFSRCIKCYGCRDVCPMCFCKECSLEHPELMTRGLVPPDAIFQLVRAVHMAGRCIDCGLCEEACPARIPLRVLYKKGNALVQEFFDYVPGSSGAGLSPWKFLGEVVTLETKPLLP